MSRTSCLALVLFCVLAHGSIASACHPECTWQCDDPVCPALCEIQCPNNLCSDAQCSDQSCNCESFGKAEASDCKPPLDSCPSCEVKRVGQKCTTDDGVKCSCTIGCSTNACTWSCQTPVSCPKPTCKLACESPACEAQ